MPDWLIDPPIGPGLSGIAFRWKKPLALRATLIAVFLALTALFRLLVLNTHPWGSGPWQERLFFCAAALPMGVCFAASYFRLRKNKRS